MRTPIEHSLTLGDCLALMDSLDSCLVTLGRAKAPTVEDIQLKSMLTVVRREIANRVFEMTQTDIVRGPWQYVSDSERTA